MSNLKRIRVERCMTQKELAKLLGVSRTTIANAEKEMPLCLARHCESFLDVSAVEIFGEDILKIKPETEEEREMIIATIKAIKL